MMFTERPPGHLILASSSPRRAELMKSAGYQFRVIAPDDDAEDGFRDGERPSDGVARLAYQKAKNVAKKYHQGLFIGCDTVGEVDGKILGKPANRKEALSMLLSMSGRQHRVFSGLCVWQRPENRTVIRVQETLLEMNTLSATFLKEYLDSNQWRGKAGAFGFQDGLNWIQIIKGSPSNVVGLPMEILAEVLDDLTNDPVNP